MSGSAPLQTETLAAETLAAWLALEPAQLLRRCAQAPFQGPGPGGQKRNRVYSGVRLLHAESGLAAEASERREARRNLEDALHRLRMAMALSLAPVAAARAPAAPSPAGPIQAPNEAPDPAGANAAVPAAVLPGPAFRPGASPLHPDFPRLVLRALHALDARGGRLSETAAALGCTASALTRFLAADKAVWAAARAVRERHGLKPLKR
jgi:hypothetical protein